MVHQSFILTKEKYKRYLLAFHLLHCVCFRITKVTSPILILHAEDDSVIPYQLGQQVPPDPALCVCVCVLCLRCCCCLYLFCIGCFKKASYAAGGNVTEIESMTYSMQFSSAQLSSVQFSLPQFSSAYLSSAQLTSVQFSLAQFSSAYLSSAQPSSGQLSSVQDDIYVL